MSCLVCTARHHQVDARGRDAGPLVFQELFSKQKGYLDEELDYRKQSLDQAHKVRDMWLLEPVGVGCRLAVETGKVVHMPGGVSQGLGPV